MRSSAFTAASLSLALVSSPAFSQARGEPQLIAAQQAAMAKLAWMDGQWRGPAVSQTATGEHKVTQTERIGTMLDGTLRVVEGRGFNPDGSKGFNAFGVISFNPYSGKYEFRSYAQGNAGTFALTPTGNGYVWETPAGQNAVLRYTATLAGGTWTEIGERVSQGQAPVRVFEMHLRRFGDSAWPEGGSLKPE